jgi:hypothetical protein
VQGITQVGGLAVVVQQTDAQVKSPLSCNRTCERTPRARRPQ